MNFDDRARQCFKNSPNTIISWILLASYCYYLRYESILSDETYDKMMKYVKDNYNTLQHRHKNLLDKGMIEAGTAFNLRANDYPLIVKATAEQLMEEMNEQN